MKKFLIILMMLGVVGLGTGCQTMREALNEPVRCSEAPTIPNLPPIDSDGLVRLTESHRADLLVYFERVEYCLN